MSGLDLPPTRRAQASAWLTLRTRARRGELDRLLAEGRNPATDPRLTLRAAQFARPAARAHLAAGIRAALRSVDETALALRRQPQAPVDVASVRQCADDLNDLAQALTGMHARVRGVAIVSALLNDGLGPLYVSGQADRLRSTILSARTAL